MHGDFSNVTFNPRKQFSGVFELQGRVGLDAPRNELQAILQHHLRSALADVLGDAAGPRADAGFAIETVDSTDLLIGPGRYYVDGIAVRNDEPTSYLRQPLLDRFSAPDDPPALPPRPYLVYLHVWERHVTEVEDPSLHEFALGVHHPDSSSRAQVCWRVGVAEVPGDQTTDAKRTRWVREWLAAARLPGGRLEVRASRPEDTDADPCTAAPDAAYVGENQLYRVEILRGTGAQGGPSFVWSRDNGSGTYPVTGAAGATLTLGTLGRDWHSALREGDWVEVVDDAVSLRPGLGGPGDGRVISRITGLDPEHNRVTLDPPPPFDVATRLDLHPYLRRWDMPPAGDGGPGPTTFGVPVGEAAGGATSGWVPLEQGVEIRFVAAADGEPAHRYRSDDHWVFAARRVLADVVYDNPDGRPQGVEHHFAPLAFVGEDGSTTGLRRLFSPVSAQEK